MRCISYWLHLFIYACIIVDDYEDDEMTIMMALVNAWWQARDEGIILLRFVVGFVLFVHDFIIIEMAHNCHRNKFSILLKYHFPYIRYFFLVFYLRKQIRKFFLLVQCLALQYAGFFIERYDFSFYLSVQCSFFLNFLYRKCKPFNSYYIASPVPVNLHFEQFVVFLCCSVNSFPCWLYVDWKMLNEKHKGI